MAGQELGRRIRPTLLAPTPMPTPRRLPRATRSPLPPPQPDRPWRASLLPLTGAEFGFLQTGGTTFTSRHNVRSADRDRCPNRSGQHWHCHSVDCCTSRQHRREHQPSAERQQRHQQPGAEPDVCRKHHHRGRHSDRSGAADQIHHSGTDRHFRSGPGQPTAAAGFETIAIRPLQ